MAEMKLDMDSWIIDNFMPFQQYFSHQDNHTRVIMNVCVQWYLVED